MKHINNRILLAEDDPNLGTVLKDSLELEDNYVELFADGEQAWKSFNKDDFDICILDVMMPLKDGFTLAKEIKKVAPKMPIIFLTAKSMKEDKLQGFEIGADDYLTKPFSMEELLARINAILRRIETPKEENEGDKMVGKIKYEPELRLLHLEEGIKKLTTKENQLLKLLVKNENEILDRQATLRAIWGDDNYFNGRSMDVYIAKLRKALKEDPSIEIMNVHGKGFKLIIK